MKTLNIKVFSLCNDFNPDEGFEEMYNELSEYNDCNVYIPYRAYTKETLEKEGYQNDLISNRLVELGAIDGEEVLIHIDY